MVGLGSLSGGGVLIAGGGAGCTDCFQDDAESVGASLLVIGGTNPISILTPPLQAAHHPVARELGPAGLRSSPKPATAIDQADIVLRCDCCVRRKRAQAFRGRILLFRN